MFNLSNIKKDWFYLSSRLVGTIRDWMNVSNFCMDWPMLYTGNPYIIQPGNVFFMHMILMDSDNELAMNLGETYLVTENGNERLGKQKLDLIIL